MNSVSARRGSGNNGNGVRDADGTAAAAAAAGPHNGGRAPDAGNNAYLPTTSEYTDAVGDSDVNASGRGATAASDHAASSAPDMSVDDNEVAVVRIVAANAGDGGSEEGMEGAEVMGDVEGVGGDVREAAAAAGAGPGAGTGAGAGVDEREAPGDGGLPMARILR